jgi:pyruvate/2-oxoglutarate dehydrogenase complex dihydrolipoamide acyltransferase (E2) component
MRYVRKSEDISVSPNLWGTSILPEGILEKWTFTDGSQIEAGDPVATVRIESALHEVMAPVTGRLHIACQPNTVIEPGTVIGQISHLV